MECVKLEAYDRDWRRREREEVPAHHSYHKDFSCWDVGAKGDHCKEMMKKEYCKGII